MSSTAHTGTVLFLRARAAPEGGGPPGDGDDWDDGDDGDDEDEDDGDE
ncbi:MULTISPECIES: hypothetical protein [unclassified Streptomyces]